MDPSVLRREIRGAVQSGLFTQKQLAVRAGVTEGNLSNFLGGKRGLRASTASRIEKAFSDLSARVDRPSEEQVRTQYLARLCEFVAALDLRWAVAGFPDQRLGDIPASGVFVPPTCQEISTEKQYEGLDIDALSRPVCHLLGPAGSGKTMLVRHTVETLASNGGGVLPIFFPLNALNYLLPHQRLSDSAESLRKLIRSWYENTGFGRRETDILDDLFVDALETGKAFVLLDGLDELRSDLQRRCEAMINRFVRRYSSGREGSNRFLVTQRGSPPYQRFVSLANETRLFIAPFALHQKERLVTAWERLVGDPRKPHAVFVLKSLVEDAGIKALTRYPLFLTLMTLNTLIGRTPGMRPSKVRALGGFVDGVFGHWDNVRSLDGHPTPRVEEFDPNLSPALLSHLAWRMIGACAHTEQSDYAQYDVDETTIPYDRAIESVVHQQKEYRLKPPAAGSDSPEITALPEETARRLQADSEDFIAFCVDTGLLAVASPRGDDSQHLQFGPHEQIVRDWFLAHGLRFRPAKLTKLIQHYGETPCPAWKYPLSLAIAAMSSLDRNVDGVIEAVSQLLRVRPLPDSDGIRSDRLGQIIPLGIEACVRALEDDVYAPRVEQTILDQLLEFYEQNNYAVVVDYLQPRVIALLPRTKRAETIPRSVEQLTAWVTRHRELGPEDWARHVDKLWRYQNEVSCIKVLLDALNEREAFDLPRSTFQILFRRCMFALRCGAMEPKHEALALLRTLRKRADLEAEIRQMIEYAYRELSGDQTALAEPTFSSSPPLLVSSVASIEELVVFIMKPYDWPEIFARSGEWLDVFCTSLDDEAAARRVLEGLTALLRDPARIPRQGMDERFRRKVQAIAAVLLARFFQHQVLGHTWRSVLPTGEFAFVLPALLEAADDREEREHQNVYACQVYDVAAWALRAIFYGRDANELKGLPLIVAPPP